MGSVPMSLILTLRASQSLPWNPNTTDEDSILKGSGHEGFKFKPFTINDVILAISHFSSQARGEDEIP